MHKQQQGINGSKGNTGLPGNKGVMGSDGFTGNIVRYNKGNDQPWYVCIQGDKGRQGMQGDLGMRGDVGSTGEKVCILIWCFIVPPLQGNIGNKGSRGNQGTIGARGSPVSMDI